jgi:hypothetical protein
LGLQCVDCIRADIDRVRAVARLGSLNRFDQGRAMNGEGLCEGVHRGQQPLLQSDEGKFCASRLAGRQSRNPFRTNLAVFAQHLCERQLGLGPRRIERDRLDGAFREAVGIETTQVRLEAPDHDAIEVPGVNVHAAGKTLWVEHFEQRRE